jgi:hypothetical protein
MKYFPVRPYSMKKYLLFAIFFFFIVSCSFAVTFSGENVPYDASFHIGLVNGPGTGIGIGADMYYPLNGFNLGGELEEQVTNSDYNQNINITRFGVTTKFDINEWFFVSLHLGRCSFYLAKAADYIDTLTGEQLSFDAETNGSATYLAVAPNFRAGEYIITPKVALDYIVDGGTMFEMNLNVGHVF